MEGEKVLNNRLKELIARKERQTNERITYRSLASELDISKTTIDRWVNNRIRDYNGDLVVKFCGYFDCNVGDLLVIETVSGHD